MDGSSANDGSHSSIEVIIRDDKGHPVAALSKVLQSHYFAEVVEMLALEQGVLLAQEMELFQVIFKSDALNVIQAINEGITGSEAGPHSRNPACPRHLHQL